MSPLSVTGKLLEVTAVGQSVTQSARDKRGCNFLVFITAINKQIVEEAMHVCNNEPRVPGPIFSPLSVWFTKDPEKAWDLKANK